jgi:Zn-dependent protease/predicted transcriptional regulator
MGGTLTLFHVRGIPVRVHPSWLVIVGLLTWTLAVGYFPHELPNLPLYAHWANGLLATLLLFASVFLHELSHSLMALRFGIPVTAITLHIFGGVSELGREPERPGQEFAVAVVGPLTSLAIAALVGALLVLGEPAPAVAAILRYLVVVNIVVGLFNLVPGFPLDGGRLLRALVWKLRGSLREATRAATLAGSAFAFFLMGVGILRALTGEFLGGLWLLLIGLFLRQAAEGSYQHLLLERTLRPRAVRDVMAREVIAVPSDLTLDQVIGQYFERHHVTSFPVVDRDRPVGILPLRQLKDVPRERWERTPVRDLMLALDESLTAAPGDSLWLAFTKLSRNGLGRLAVLENGRLVGYLSMKDVLHVIAVAEVSPGRQGGPP